MTKLIELINNIKKLSTDAVSTLLDSVNALLVSENLTPKSDCPYCGSSHIIRYGHKCGKQRFLCKQCERTFVTTTHTIMSQSHFQEGVWQEIISDTIRGNAIEFSAERLGMNHQTAFNMRHKLLLALQNLPGMEDIMLGGVSELDETYVLDSYKGKKLPEEVDRKPRKHGEKAKKRGISNEYVCICTGIERNGAAYAATINRAKPDASELVKLFEDHISQGTLVLCDGLKSYNILPTIAECTVKNCNVTTEEEKHFYHLNTINGFHSFIKKRYGFYCGVATKYLNRYNVLFAASYRNIENLINQAKQVFLSVGTTDYYHSNKEVKTASLLAI